jgi:hypothetical protein
VSSAAHDSLAADYRVWEVKKTLHEYQRDRLESCDRQNTVSCGYHKSRSGEQALKTSDGEKEGAPRPILVPAPDTAAGAPGGTAL